VSQFVKHEACEKCGSSDAKSVYDDGHTFCFACESYGGKSVESDPGGEFQALRSRRIGVDVCRKFDYRLGVVDGKPAQLAVYHSPKDGTPVATKVRFANKNFKWIGQPKQAGLYGQHLWNGGRRLVITEGELDCLSIAESQSGGSWPVVSLPNGAQGGRRDCQKQLEWLEKFDTIVLCLDQDEPGRKAALEIADILTPGKAVVAELPMKDANEVLTKGNAGDITRAIFSARELRPDGIIEASELWSQVEKDDRQSDAQFPWQFLNNILYGLRTSEIVTITAGAGLGKSALVREIVYHLLQSGHKVGACFLEETPKRTLLGLMGIHIDLPLHLPDGRAKVGDTDLLNAFEAFGGDKLYLYDHFGSTDPEHLYRKIKYMAKGCGCRVIVLDHISMVLSGLGNEHGDERRLLDNIMTELRVLAQQLDVIMLVVSHLRRPQGTGFESGAQTSLADLRGSSSIAGLSDQVISLERNQQDEETKHVTTVRVLKNRFSGETGVAGTLLYNRETGRLEEDVPF